MKVIKWTEKTTDGKKTVTVNVDNEIKMASVIDTIKFCEPLNFAKLQSMEKNHKTKEIPFFNYWNGEKMVMATMKTVYSIVGGLNAMIIGDKQTPEFFFMVVDNVAKNDGKGGTFQIKKCVFDVDTMEYVDGKPRNTNKTEKTDEEKFIAYVEKSGFCKDKILQLLEQCKFEK